MYGVLLPVIVFDERGKHTGCKPVLPQPVPPAPEEFEEPQVAQLLRLLTGLRTWILACLWSAWESYRIVGVSKDTTSESWKDVVRQALAQLGGQANLKQMNEAIMGHPKTRTNPTWRDTIRRVVREYAIFEPVPPNRSGIYRLVEEPALPEPRREKADHGTVQGMILRLGRIYGYETFAPATDRASRQFQGRPLNELTTIHDCSGFCSSRASLAKVRQIDAIWLEEDKDGPYPAYAFEVENTTRVRSGIDRLTEIPRRYRIPLFVIGPGDVEKHLFGSLVEQNRYRPFKPQLHFREYAELERLFNAAVSHDETRNSFGVAPRFSH